MKIEMADGLTLPANAAVQVYAFLGRRGSGKTFGAGRLVEQVVAAGNQVVILDPVGTWYGLRLAANGKTPGISIPVFGGYHGDIPLEATAGKVVAELAAQKGTSLVLDVSEFTGADQRRFVADFATEFFHAKKRHRSAVLVVMEEAQEFAPQHVRGDNARMVGAVERMIKLGRNFGIGTAMVSQRPQAVNKDVLNQTEAMFCFQMTGPQERKTIEGWVQEKGAGGRDIGNELPGLPVGTALMWSPQWLGLFGKFKIHRKTTYDASATPDAIEKASAPLAPIDLDQVKAAMAATIEEAKGKDPNELRREVARLRAELAKKPVAQAAPITVEVVPEAIREASEGARAEIRNAHERLIGAEKLLNDQIVAIARSAQASKPTKRPFPTNGHAPATARAAPTNGHRKEPGDGEPLVKGAREILAVLASRYPTPLTRAQISTLSRFAPNGGTFRTYMGKLGTLGLMQRDGDVFRITETGLREIGPVPAPSTPRELRRAWCDVLQGKAKDMLEFLAVEGRPFERNEIAEALGMEADGGTFRTYLGKLTTNGLVERRGKTYAAVPSLVG